MARTPIIAGNWKMNNTAAAGVALVKELAPLVKEAAATVVVCPTATALAGVTEAVKGTNIAVGAQNVHWEKSGAYTGEISTEMLTELGVSYCVLGHSERRDYFGETNEGVNKRAHAAYAAGITPIICCGESLEIREAGTYLACRGSPYPVRRQREAGDDRRPHGEAERRRRTRRRRSAEGKGLCGDCEFLIFEEKSIHTLGMAWILCRGGESAPPEY